MSILRLEKRVETPGRKRVNFSSQKMLKDNNKKNRKKTKPLSNTATKKSTLVLSTSKTLLTRMGMHDGLLFKLLQNNVGGCLFLFNKQLIFDLYMSHKNWPKSNTVISIRKRGTPPKLYFEPFTVQPLY